ncbi:deoxyribose-phosphate aldolase [Pontiella agarivorans]|uniref:Deoxyribose-phosphate aldolase n=1 Tax=Pontiella agarivorans TaxID=3038953 RepID=A0ABU5MT64_9BACT|nr:deoxyribose-phosphate aldolase [Pontiella agarivorans]MDZ8117384.1 deoxyribose-phosphate aldolase [Pontiella agarivorans]
MPYTMEQVASTIDHAVLKPNQTVADVRSNADMCLKYGVASMCVRPCDVRLASELLNDSKVLVSTVLSFPHGADTTAAKITQARLALEDGAREIDMVMNIGRFLSGNYDDVRKDIQAVTEIAHAENALVKVIQESCFLTLEEVAAACEISREAGADFVKTSTGFGPSSATPEIIDVMVKTVGETMGVKASGGIRTWDQAIGFLQQGATRLGIGATETVLNGRVSEETY